MSSTRFGLSVKESKSLRVRRDVSYECKTVEVKQLPLRRGDIEFQRETDSSLEMWETSGCLHGRSDDHGVRLFPVILLCINSSFP